LKSNFQTLEEEQMIVEVNGGGAASIPNKQQDNRNGTNLQKLGRCERKICSNFGHVLFL